MVLTRLGKIRRRKEERLRWLEERRIDDKLAYEAVLAREAAAGRAAQLFSRTALLPDSEVSQTNVHPEVLKMFNGGRMSVRLFRLQRAARRAARAASATYTASALSADASATSATSLLPTSAYRYSVLYVYSLHIDEQDAQYNFANLLTLTHTDTGAFGYCRRMLRGCPV